MSTPIDDETLVAYLDGELPYEQQTHIEQRLHDNIDLRQRVSALQASWDLLGDLPSCTPRADLAQSTIEIVTLAIERESRSWWGWLVANRLLLLGLSGLLMLAAGAATSRGLVNYQTQKTLTILPVIVDYPSLQYIDSVEFLQALVQVDNLAAAAGTNATRTMIGDGQVPSEIDDRKTWIENLPADSRGRLRNHLDDYEKLTDDKRQSELQSITQEILKSPADTSHYLNTIRAYRAILEAMGEKNKNDLLDLLPLKRIEAIKSRVAVLSALNYVPNDEDRRAFRDWRNAIIDKEENMEQFYILTDTQIIGELTSGDPESSVVIKEDMDDLINRRLSPTTARLLANITDETLRRYSLGMWMLSPPAGERPTGPKDLQEIFETRSEQLQNELEFLPENEARKRLRSASDVPAAPNPPR